MIVVETSTELAALLPPRSIDKMMPLATVEEVTDETFLESYVHLKKGPEFLVLFFIKYADPLHVDR